MRVFGAYARYYDLLYSDKDYAAEAQYVHRLIQSYAPGARSILELGCGTGAHAVLLAGEGYRIHGVDLSTDMLERAKIRLADVPPEQASRLEFAQGDIRTVRINGKFDAVISLFDVISYQTTNEDLRAVFATAKAHLKPGGVFIFDCWYGPAVLSDRPTVRSKRVEDEEIAVTRIAEPVMYPNENCVDVNYQLFIKDKASGTVEELRECHRMRYLFSPEIKQLFADMQMEIVAAYKWMTDQEPGLDTWSVCFVGRRL
jgi:SAM-dependent methyltransferase